MQCTMVCGGVVERAGNVSVGLGRRSMCLIIVVSFDGRLLLVNRSGECPLLLGHHRPLLILWRIRWLWWLWQKAVEVSVVHCDLFILWRLRQLWWLLQKAMEVAVVHL